MKIGYAGLAEYGTRSVHPCDAELLQAKSNICFVRILCINDAFIFSNSETNADI